MLGAWHRVDVLFGVITRNACQNDENVGSWRFIFASGLAFDAWRFINCYERQIPDWITGAEWKKKAKRIGRLQFSAKKPIHFWVWQRARRTWNNRAYNCKSLTRARLYYPAVKTRRRIWKKFQTVPRVGGWVVLVVSLLFHRCTRKRTRSPAHPGFPRSQTFSCIAVKFILAKRAHARSLSSPSSSSFFPKLFVGTLLHPVCISGTVVTRARPRDSRLVFETLTARAFPRS